MSEEQTSPIVPKSKKPSKKVRAPRAARVIDPAILAIRQQAAEQIKQHRKLADSGKVLARIIAKDLPRLSVEHRFELAQAMNVTGAATTAQ